MHMSSAQRFELAALNTEHCYVHLTFTKLFYSVVLGKFQFSEMFVIVEIVELVSVLDNSGFKRKTKLKHAFQHGMKSKLIANSDE